MARRLSYQTPRYRYVVEDDTITTWRIRDTLSGDIVRDGMEHYDASLEAARLNTPGETDEHPTERWT